MFFLERLREKVGMIQRENLSREIEVLPVEWVNPRAWKGFGDNLPFDDKSFDVVLLRMQ